MKMQMEQILSLHLCLWLILLAIIGTSTATITTITTTTTTTPTVAVTATPIPTFTCPDHCSCMELQRKRYSYNHAKCTSLDGLRQLGKTSDLHSLDLSSMNLTKLTNQLDKLTNLSKLDLHDNRLSEINSLSSKRIRTLNLSRNRITSGKLAKIPTYVKHLNLSHNDITILTESFKRFIHLKSLELADNPLNCTCETLDVRNWLQAQQVWTDTPIRCMAPLNFKGRSWLQIRQSDVCESNGLDGPRMLPFSDVADDDENDNMLGDDPNAFVQTSDENDKNDDNDDKIDPDFLPVTMDEKRNKRTDAQSNSSDELKDISDDAEYHDEGSGSSIEETSPSSTEGHLNVYEGSGDDTKDELTITYNESISNETSTEDDEIVDDITEITPLNLNSSEIGDSKETTSPILPISSDEEEEHTAEEEDDADDDIDTTLPTIIEETIIPEKSSIADAEFIQTDGANDGTGNRSESAKIDDNIHESKSTYILLAILGVILIALILYVAAKRNRSTAVKNRRNNNDVESPAQELLNMDKSNLGKPIPSNQVEFIPLIPEKHAADKKSNLYHAEEPLLQKLSEAENENDQSGDSLKEKDEPQPPKQLNGNAKPIQNGLHTDKQVDSNGNEDNKQFQPISPKPSRYSPVYSHDTGRVKIKLSETTRPKTPILVTRSRSNAGDDKYENKISQ